ncbi:MAG: tetratricopeptide repeat protein [Rhodobacterales bacterium]|nr:tetratricopeptide repeat protein [Rhodobacterales bacterium]
MQKWFQSARSVALHSFRVLGCLTLISLSSGPAYALTPIDTALAAGDVGGAIVLAKAITDASPGDMDAHELYIDLMLAAAQGARAEQMYRSMIQSDPTNPDLHYLHGRAAVSGKEAQAAFERALRIDPDHARSHMGIAAVHSAKGAMHEAAMAYRRAVMLDGSLGEAWMGWVRMHIEAGDYEGAILVAQDGLRAVPAEGGLYMVVATLDGKQALEMLERGATEAPDDARVLSALAEVYLSLEQPDKALMVARRALRVSPSLPSPTLTEMFASALAAETLDYPGYRALIQAREQQGVDPSAAVASFNTLVSKYPKCALVLLGRAQLHDQLGQSALSLTDLALALQRDQNLMEAQAAFGLTLVRADRSKEALPWLTAATAGRPWDASLAIALGRAQSKTGDHVAAVRTLKVQYLRKPWDVPTLLQYAEVLQSAGLHEEAYRLVITGLKDVGDPRLAAALVMTAIAAGHPLEAANFLEDLGHQGNSQALLDLASRLRAQAKP